MKPVRRKPKYCLIAIGAVLLALLAQPALAALKQWNGPNPNTNWNNANNWLPTGVPVAGDDASLTSTTSKTATYNLTPNPGVLNSVIVDATGGGTFTLNQSSSSTALSALTEFVGDFGKGVYNQSGGSNTITNALVLGANAGSNGTYNKSGGSLSAGGVVVGLAGTGTFNQSSGNVTIGTYQFDPGQPFSLILGGTYNSGSPITTGNGTYKMSSGVLTVGSGEVVGQAGTGTFTQSSGTHTVNGLLSVGNQTGATGTFTQSSGSLKVTGDEYIGASGTGSFTQSSGSHTVGGEFDVGRNGTSSGTFKMSSGSLSVGGTEYIGYFGPGSFTQSSGSNTAGGDFYLAYAAGASGSSYSMSSGSLTVKGPNGEFIGNNAPATFTQSSGSNTAKTIAIAPNAGTAYAVTYNLNGGSMTATSAAADAIHIYGPYHATSGTNPVSDQGGNLLIKNTATVNGNVTNDGLIKTTSATVTWNGVVTNNSAYISDPPPPATSGSTQTFNKDLVVSSSGYLVSTSTPTGTHPDSTPLDLFIFKNDFVNQSTQNTKFNTLGAEMKFVTGTDATPTGHNLYIPGAPGGSSANNFSWHTMDITGQTITLYDPTPGDGGTLYLYEGLIGAVISGNTITNIIDQDYGLNIYYDKNSAVNAYLGGLNYNLAGPGGGNLIAHTPLPPSVLLLGSGLLGLGALGWRRKRQG